MSTLKQSLMKLYAGNDDIIDLLDQIDMTDVEKRFQQEMDARITRDEVAVVESMLVSPLVFKYDEAILASTLATTRQISELLEFVLSKNEGDLN